MIAIASAPPSSGSVPAPASSSRTSAGSSSALSIATMFAMWPENVLRLAAMDCSSPMSAKTVRNTGICEPSAAGISNPACAMSDSSPAVLSATVLPPVFGPVTTSTRTGGIRRTSTGTTAASGFRASGSEADGGRRMLRDVPPHRRDEQRVTPGADFETAVGGDRGLRAVNGHRELRPGLQHVESRSPRPPSAGGRRRAGGTHRRAPGESAGLPRPPAARARRCRC